MCVTDVNPRRCPLDEIRLLLLLLLLLILHQFCYQSMKSVNWLQSFTCCLSLTDGALVTDEPTHPPGQLLIRLDNILLTGASDLVSVVGRQRRNWPRPNWLAAALKYFESTSTCDANKIHQICSSDFTRTTLFTARSFSVVRCLSVGPSVCHTPVSCLNA